VRSQILQIQLWGVGFKICQTEWNGRGSRPSKKVILDYGDDLSTEFTSIYNHDDDDNDDDDDDNDDDDIIVC